MFYYVVLLYMYSANIENVNLFQEISIRKKKCGVFMMVCIACWVFFFTGENFHLIWSCWKHNLFRIFNVWELETFHRIVTGSIYPRYYFPLNLQLLTMRFRTCSYHCTISFSLPLYYEGGRVCLWSGKGILGIIPLPEQLAITTHQSVDISLKQN